MLFISGFLLTPAFFHPISSIFVLSRNTDIDYILIHNLITFIESLKIVLTNMIIVLKISANLATLAPLKIKVFQNKGYGIIIFVHDVTS